MKKRTYILFFAVLLFAIITIFLLYKNSNKISISDISGEWTRKTYYGIETYNFSDTGKFTYERESTNDSNDLRMKYNYKLVKGKNGNYYIDVSNCKSDDYEKYCNMFDGHMQIDIIDGNLNFVGNVVIKLKRKQ